MVAGTAQKPNFKPATTLIASLSMRRPHEEIGLLLITIIIIIII